MALLSPREHNQVLAQAIPLRTVPDQSGIQSESLT